MTKLGENGFSKTSNKDDDQVQLCRTFRTLGPYYDDSKYHPSKESKIDELRRRQFEKELASGKMKTIEENIKKFIKGLGSRPSVKKLAGALIVQAATKGLGNKVHFQHIHGFQEINPNCVKDLDEKTSQLLDTASESTIQNLPEMLRQLSQLNNSKYHQIVPVQFIEPNEMQKNVIKFLASNEKAFVILHSMLGTGKTTLATAIGAGVKEKCHAMHTNSNTPAKTKSEFNPKNRGRNYSRKNGKSLKRLRAPEKTGIKVNKSSPLLVFCCPVSGVNNEVRTAFEKAEIKSTTLHLSHEDIHKGTVRLMSTGKVHPSTVHSVVATPEAVIALQALSQEVKNDVEKTSRFIQSDSLVDDLCEREFVLFYDEPFFSDPKIVDSVLFSGQWSKIVMSSATLPDMQKYKQMFPDHEHTNIRNNYAPIECNANLFPNCSKVRDLVKLRASLELGVVARFFTLKNLLKFRETLSELMVMDVEEYDIKVQNVQTISVINEWKSLFDGLIQIGADDVVEQVFAEFDSKRNSEEEVVPIKDFLTEFRKSSNSPTIYATSDPVSASKAALDGLIPSEEQLPLYENITKKHLIVSKQRSSAEKDARKRYESSKQRKDEQERTLCEDLENVSCLGSVNLPRKYIVNKNKSSSVIRDLEDLDGVVLPSHIVLLLASGVGVYSKSLPESYRKLVLERASSGSIKVIIADESIAYGVNLQVDIVVIDDSLGNVIDGSTLFQLIGRSGRLGKSKFSKMIAGQKTKERILAVCVGADIQTVGPGEDPFHENAKLIQAAFRRYLVRKNIREEVQKQSLKPSPKKKNTRKNSRKGKKNKGKKGKRSKR